MRLMLRAVFLRACTMLVFVAAVISQPRVEGRNHPKNLQSNDLKYLKYQACTNRTVTTQNLTIYNQQTNKKSSITDVLI